MGAAPTEDLVTYTLVWTGAGQIDMKRSTVRFAAMVKKVGLPASGPPPGGKW